MNKQQNIKKIMIVVSFIALCVAGAIFTNRFFNREIIQQQETKLAQEIDLMISVIKKEKRKVTEYHNTTELDYLVNDGERLTLLDQDGVILYDSSHDKEAIGKRDQRPEVTHVLKGEASIGTALRESHTLNEKLLYVAKPLIIDNQLVGVMRLSEKYTGFSNSIIRFQRIVTFALIGLVSIILGLIFYFFKQANEPLKFMLPALQAAINHPEKMSEIDTTSVEWNQLYQSVNQLMRETNQLYYQQLFNEEKLQFLLESLTIGVFIMNEEGHILSANPVMSDLFKPKIGAETYQEWFLERDIKELIAEILRNGQEIQAEVKLLEPSEKDLKIVLRKLEPGNQQAPEYVGVLYDITDIRKLELIHQDFISNISHELKTPTTSIMGFAETLLDGALGDQTVATEFVEIIELEANRLYALIQNILLLLRTETSEGKADIMSVPPVSVIEEELQRYQPQMTSKNLKVTVSYDDLGEVSLPVDYFQPIVKNLIENAVAYTGEEGQLHVSLKRRGAELLFTIVDTGVGISESDQERIFERFYRVSKSRQRNVGGSGLGLSIVSHYTQLLHGKLTLESQLQSGTRVSVLIPIQES